MKRILKQDPEGNEDDFIYKPEELDKEWLEHHDEHINYPEKGVGESEEFEIKLVKGKYFLLCHIRGGELEELDGFSIKSAVRIQFCPQCGQQLAGLTKKEKEAVYNVNWWYK